MISGLTHEARRTGRERKEGKEGGETERRKWRGREGRRRRVKGGRKKIAKLNGTGKPFNLTQLT